MTAIAHVRAGPPRGIERVAIEALAAQLWPGATVLRLERLGGGDDGDDASSKGFGYGSPIRIRARDRSGRLRDAVLHTATANEFGHDRRADRAEEMLLAFDTFGAVPNQVAAVDVGAVGSDGRLISLRDAGEFYLVTEYAVGALYAGDLRRIAHHRAITSRDIERCDRLADYLVQLHAERLDDPVAYRRAIRDLVGHGEGIFGIVDGYPADVSRSLFDRLRAIEHRCVEWRWRARGCEARLCRTHGDFHPFNILFDDRDELSLLDTSRGSCGDPADDLTCLTINYVLFALDHPDAWDGHLGGLWDRLWRRYLDATRDRELLELAPPFLAWRALVLANPRWYPAMPDDGRDLLLSLAERTLDAGRLDLELPDRLLEAMWRARLCG